MKYIRLEITTHLNTELPLGICTRDDGLLEVLPVEVWILPGDLEGFIPHQAMDSKLRCPVKLDEMTFPFSVNEGERVDAEPLHHPK